jgi:hypothetical protein
VTNRLAAVVLAAAIVSLALVRDAATSAPTFAETKWPFLLDQWGTGRAFRCAPADCGVEINIYLRAKIGFCNCATGVADDAELDRVGDISLLSDRFAGKRDGQTVTVGWMSGRSRLYDVRPNYGSRLPALAIAVNDKCDVIVATVTAGKEISAEAERAALAFLNSVAVLTWAKTELGV